MALRDESNRFRPGGVRQTDDLESGESVVTTTPTEMLDDAYFAAFDRKSYDVVSSHPDSEGLSVGERHSDGLVALRNVEPN
jgi:hypothetical protein